MDFLPAIQKQTEWAIKELGWTQEQIDDFVNLVNSAMSENTATDVVDTLVYHPAKYEGGFIVFGGWTRVFDQNIKKGLRGHELYLAFGGLGIGGWSGNASIQLTTDEQKFTHDGKLYKVPKYHYNKGDKWTSYNTGFEWFHDNVKSFMFMYLPVFEQDFPIFAYYDGKSRQIGLTLPSASISIGMGGGTVDVRS